VLASFVVDPEAQIQQHHSELTTALNMPFNSRREAHPTARVPACVIFNDRQPSKNVVYQDAVPVAVEGKKCKRVPEGANVVFFTKGSAGGVTFIARAGQTSRRQGLRSRHLLQVVDVDDCIDNISYNELKLASKMKNLYDGHNIEDRDMVLRIQTAWQSANTVEILSESDSSVTSGSEYMDESEVSSD
jgi:hypothetical protein